MPFFILFYTKSMQKVYFCSQNVGICYLVAIVERRASSFLCSQFLNLITYWGNLLFWGVFTRIGSAYDEKKDEKLGIEQ